jgi:hypothetical protein
MLQKKPAVDAGFEPKTTTKDDRSFTTRLLRTDPAAGFSRIYDSASAELTFSFLLKSLSDP